MQILLNVIMPVFLLIAAGYIAVWRFKFPYDGVESLMTFAQSYAIPCLLFQAISRLDLKHSFHPDLLLSYYAGAGICFFVGMIGARLLIKRGWEDCVAIGFCCLFSNSLLLGLPITEQAFGAQALTGNYAIISIHSPFCYALGITVMEFVRNRGQSGISMLNAVLKAMFKNVLVMAIALGFVMNLSGLSFPHMVNDALDLIVRAGLPVALFALGGILFKYKPEGDKLAIFMVCVIGLGLHPILTWGFGRAFSLPQDLFRSGVMTAAMAPGINAYIFANMYGRAKRIAASSVLIATIVSIFSIWFWLSVI